jgi:hypothetical protein
MTGTRSWGAAFLSRVKLHGALKMYACAQDSRLMGGSAAFTSTVLMLERIAVQSSRP